MDRSPRTLGLSPLCVALTVLLASGLLVSGAAAADAFDEALFGSLEWREVGPYRGGRSAAVAGVPSQPQVYYFGATGGGVWKTTDAGKTWESVSDGGDTWERILHVSDEAAAVDLAMDPTNPRILYATIWRVRRAGALR